MKNLYIFFFIIITTTLFNQASIAQGKKSRSNANTELGHLIAPVKKTYNKSNELARLVAMINKHPDSLDLHHEYIRLAGVDNVQMQHQYEIWMQRYPKAGIYPWALAISYFEWHKPEAADYLLKTIALDSTNAKAWDMLSTTAEISGETLKSVEYSKKATDIAPQNAYYVYSYAAGCMDIDTALSRALLLNVANRFPKTSTGATALTYLTIHTKDTLAQVQLLEKIYTDYGISFDNSRWATNQLYELYLRLNPKKAIPMCVKYHWEPRKQLAQNLAGADSLIKQNNYVTALALLDSAQNIKGLTLDNFSAIPNFLLLKRASIMDMMGNSMAAYNLLLEPMAQKPSDKLLTALKIYAAKAGKNESEINRDVWNCLEKTAVLAPGFSSKLYTENKNVSLSDYRGKVVLLSFWFPACGPCRAEMPHFENVLKKFDRQQVVYLAVNGYPMQDNAVLPFMKQTGFSFIPLHGRSEIIEKLYNFAGYPANFLIDQEGRIIYSHFMIDDDNEDQLTLMISEILNHGSYLPASIADSAKLVDSSQIK